jgi:hypothetical protein
MSKSSSGTPASETRCPGAFYAEAAEGIARNWQLEETPDAGVAPSL